MITCSTLKACVAISWMIVVVVAQRTGEVLTPPYFNIAEKRKVTVNATCGEGVAQSEVYCKLVGYDRLDASLLTYDILDGHICDYCFPPNLDGGNATTAEKSHPVSNVVDGDTSTWWQSPPISRGLKYNRVTLSIDLQQLFQVAYVVVTMSNSPRPGVWALERSVDHGLTWQAWQYFSGNEAECQKYFGISANEEIVRDDQVICETEFSNILPIEDGEVYVSLTTGRPSAKDLFSSDTLVEWIQATNIRLRLIQTKTMLGHLMSVAQGDRTVTRRYYYSIKEISVGGRCVCNGHAFVCPPSVEDPDLLQCKCQHNTAGLNCERCAEGYVAKRWRRYTKDDLFECEPCNCNGHSSRCHFDVEVEAQGLSVDIFGEIAGGAVCMECQHFTTGINCHQCVDGYFRPEGVPTNATEPCIPCACDGDKRYTGNCAPLNGECECSPAFRGSEDCTACADGYYDYPDCKPCDCFVNGTRLNDRGIPFCVSQGSVQCPCKENFNGSFCDECANGFFNFPQCEPCECLPLGSVNDVCNRANGQCVCKPNYGSRQCDQCQDGYFNYPECRACDCDAQGTVEEICDKSIGQCLCKEGFDGDRCDRCEAKWFNYPNCEECNCAEIGSTSEVCDATTGQCPCLNNYGGKQCDQCSPGYFKYPDCSACNCDSLGSRGVSCDVNGVCNCRPNFVGFKCDQCAPERYNYPLCEECNCNPDGVTADFFSIGGCDSVPEGSLCTCKEKVTGRICDTCKPLFFNLQGWNPEGCEDCNCHRPGIMGALGICDQLDGQCSCKTHVGTPKDRACEECEDGFYGLAAVNAFGCHPCRCDVGGTQSGEDGGSRGSSVSCDKTDGQCKCLPGMTGRRCNEIEDLYYLPTFHQFTYEIEDGYRSDGSPVRIGNDEAVFPGYSWRGYGTYSQLQDEVLLDVPVSSRSVFRMILHYTNSNPQPVLGQVTMAMSQPSDGLSGTSMTPSTGETISHDVLLTPTGSDPQFVTVSGDKGIYASPFDLEPGTWTTSLKIKPDNSQDQPILVDYFVLVPNEYYEPTILKEEIHMPCVAGSKLPKCREYLYPNLDGFPRFKNAQHPNGATSDVYAWGDNPEILSELGTDKLFTIARWQPNLDFPIENVKEEAEKHILAVSFFTPENLTSNGPVGLEVNVIYAAAETEDSQPGRADIFNCPYSSLCRQVVTLEDGKLALFDLNGTTSVRLKSPSDEDILLGIESIVAIPLKAWSIDLVSPHKGCVKKDGVCLPGVYPVAPDESAVVQFTPDAAVQPISPNTLNLNNAPILFTDGTQPLKDVKGKVPKAGRYVLVAHYHQTEHPEFDIPANVALTKSGEVLDSNEAVVRLSPCFVSGGCRTVLRKIGVDDAIKEFVIDEEFSVALQNPDAKMAWLQNMVAVPLESFTNDFLEQESIDLSSDFALECGQNHFVVDPDQKGFCNEVLISLSSKFNGGALDCKCNNQGSLGYDCAKIGGQCNCKDNVIGRQCTRCKPNFFGFPDCKQCKCPPTATCNEETGDCICAPHVTGTEDEPCSKCEENTFGYDPITGCQECMCETAGTVNGNMSCSLESGACYCKDNIQGRMCDHCTAGFYQFPDCLQCPCDLRGTTEDICNQETAECTCRSNVEGEKCDTCKSGTFNLQKNNPDGCTNCFCFGKTSFCTSHDNLTRTKIESMDEWSLTSLKIDRTVSETPLALKQTLTNYGGELAVSVLNYADVDLSESTLYFVAPEEYLRKRINSFGGELRYTLTYSGYEMDGVPIVPDVLLIGSDLTLLYHSGLKIEPNTPTNFSVFMDPYYWVLPSGAPADRSKLMIVLHDLKGLYIRVNYGKDNNGQARLRGISLDSGEEASGIQDDGDKVTSVEFCQCPEGYFGYSCEDCAVGYYRSQEGPLGPICEACDCNGHAETCHPVTGECISLKPYELSKPKDEWVFFCHFRPDLCEKDSEVKGCRDNTIGEHCEKCAEGFYGDATLGTPDDCNSCPCPLPENNFAVSCDALLQPGGDQGAYCVCKPNYTGDRCEICGPGYYGEPEIAGDYCKECECNSNINVTDPDACDRTSGLCQKCLYHTYGDNCERCEPWYFGDAIGKKDCTECECDRLGTEVCDHKTGFCTCLPGVEGDKCDRCVADHWGFESGAPGCERCSCSEASIDTQCDLLTGQCLCQPGVTGQKCDRCQSGLWNLGPTGCESCGCNTEFAVGGTCDQETGQCECLEGVIGQNCDHCPDGWVLLVNETRTEKPEWKRPFDYEEGCFPCSSCVVDVLDKTKELNTVMVPIMQEFSGVEANFFAYRRLKFIDNELKLKQPEIELMDPDQSKRIIVPLEQQISNHQKTIKSLNVDYKWKRMFNMNKEAEDLDASGIAAVMSMKLVKKDVAKSIQEMKRVADGLGSGVTPVELETFVKMGQDWLNVMYMHDFSDDRYLAINEEKAARSLIDVVGDFAEPGKTFLKNLTSAEKRMDMIKTKLEDLELYSEKANKMLRVASTLNFRNSDPPASFKIFRINAMHEKSKEDVDLGNKLVVEAEEFIGDAQNSFDNLRSENSDIQTTIDNFREKIERDGVEITENYKLESEAQIHAQNLQAQASQLATILQNAKIPASRPLEAANAYENIAKAMSTSLQAVQRAKMDAENAESMSGGVGKKAIQSRERTQQLYEAAKQNRKEIVNELQPQLVQARTDIQSVKEKNKATKQAVEFISNKLDDMFNLSDKLSETQEKATDAETLAHDALASIMARSDEINRSMRAAQDLQNNHAEMKFAMDATEKALDELEARRQKRDAQNEDFNVRLNKLKESESRIAELRESNTKMMKSLKAKLSEVRKELSNIKEVGVAFKQGSYLEVQNPQNLVDLSAKTEVSLFFNVSKSATGDGRAFIFYLGNEIDTYKRIPFTSNDDFMALEIVEGGRIKLAIDLGAGPYEILSKEPIVYGEWHQVLVDRRGHFVKLILRSEDSPGEVRGFEVDDKLPGFNGSVFNLHPDYSKLFVGGFPTATTKIQESVRETYMDGQVEGLVIGSEKIGLWNYKTANSIQGAPARNKLRERAQQSVKFRGRGYITVDLSNYVDIESEFVLTMKFKATSPNGLLILMGDAENGDFVCVRLHNQRIEYSFNFGDGTHSITTSDVIPLEKWHNLEITKIDLKGSLSIDGKLVREIQSDGSMDRLSVEGDLYIGGYPNADLPYPDVGGTINFTGCVEELFLGPDRVDLSVATGATMGCLDEPQTLITFLAATPGYVQLNPLDLSGQHFEVTFMFRTLQKHGLLMYMYDTPAQHNYMSLSLVKDKGLQLNVAPDHVLTSQTDVGKRIQYDDGSWHTVSVMISQGTVQLIVDDFDNAEIKVEEFLLLGGDKKYNVFLGGLPEDQSIASIGSKLPFVGCIRDVILENDVVDFNRVLYVTAGTLPAMCKTEEVTTEGGQNLVEPEIEDMEIDEILPDVNGDSESFPEEEEEFDIWRNQPPSRVDVRQPEFYSQCKLPIRPGVDPDLSKKSGLRFGTRPDSYLVYDKLLKIKKKSRFSIELKTTHDDGIIFYVADDRHDDFISLFMKDGQLVYGFNCGSGATYITTDRLFNDGEWHSVVFSRIGNRGNLKVDGELMGEQEASGNTKSIEVEPISYLGGMDADTLRLEGVQRNLLSSTTGFVGCLRGFHLRDKHLGKWSRNNGNKVIPPCSEKVESGYFFNSGGGYINAFRKFRVGLDFDITMKIKPRNVSGILLAVQGRRDYLILQMVKGAMTFTVDNGRGPITAIFKPNVESKLCDGNWHEIHAVKAKNVVTLSVDDVFASPGIGVPGVSSTDTNHGLFIGGHPRHDRLRALQTNSDYIGCIRDIIIEGKPLVVTQSMVKGDIMSHACPTI